MVLHVQTSFYKYGCCLVFCLTELLMRTNKQIIITLTTLRNVCFCHNTVLKWGHLQHYSGNKSKNPSLSCIIRGHSYHAFGRMCKDRQLSIHPSVTPSVRPSSHPHIHLLLTTTLSCSGSQGCWILSQWSSGESHEYLDRSPVQCRSHTTYCACLWTA